MSGGDAVQHVRLEHRVVPHAGEPDAVTQKHVRVVFEVVAELRALRIFEERLQGFEHAFPIQLFGRAGIAVTHRHIRGDAGLGGERHADDLRLHVVEARGRGGE